jgi:hypothetical protein
MSQYFTDPTQEESSPHVAVIGDTAIELISVALSDGSVLTIRRDGRHYRLFATKCGGEKITNRSVPVNRIFLGEVLNNLGLEAQARATLYTLLSLRSFVLPSD